MSTLAKIIVREWKRIFRLPAHYLVLLVMPPLLFFLYAYIYNEQQADHLPVALWDEDRSAVSRQFTFLLQQVETIRFTQQVGSIGELEDLVRRGEILGAIHFPKNMERDIKSRHPVNVVVYTNAAAVVPAKLIYKEAAQVIITAGSGVILQKFVKTGMEKEKAMALVQPIVLNAYTLYNPTYNYQQYLVPGLITVGLQMIMIMVSVLLLNYETTTRTQQQLFTLAKGSASAVIIGKSIAHLTIAWLSFLLVAFVVFPFFNLGTASAAGKFFVLYTLLSLACIGIGVMLSALFADTMLATDAALFYTSPAFVFSGFTFPRWAMPWYDQYYANIMPYTHFLDGFFKVYYMDLSLRYARTEMGYLLLFIAITFSIAILLYQQQLKRLKRAVHQPA
ncbi:ABC transporter permease [Paraflavitalea sp. CAU 1676]|uniref:ABC transporter permease n=1 Tax=Paraflavitalea sp. CAU 1676 TaxID=3032598 RepID=UPI0023D9A64E|nr:ABC transporter permease [Paraflavitalea sp. CAU 1676]MDF2191600.1 ABC transporter permease [Paraflavitalea sp. CAU 1676]